MYSILGRGSFCFNYSLNSVWHGGDQFVALLRWYGSQGFFVSGLQLICIFLVSCFSFSSWQYPIDSLRGLGLVSLLASQAHQHHGHLTNFWYFWQCGQVPDPHLTIEHFSTLKQSILNEPWSTGHDGASGPCSQMASFLYDIALVGICIWWIVFTDRGFWKYSWAHLVMSMTESCRWVMQCRLRASNKGFRLVHYAQRFLQFLWIFWWCYALWMMRFAKPLQIH